MQIGIDFGTCFSIVSFLEGTAPHIPDKLQKGIPSLFMYSRNQGICLFGAQCVQGEAVYYPDDVIRHIKKKIRENPNHLDYPPLKTGGMEYSIRYILESYLDYLIGYCGVVAEEGGEITEELDAATITVPVGISSGRMMSTDYRLLLQSTVQKLTNLPASKVYVLEEPVAAAISYLYVSNRKDRVNGSQKVLVFDLGGGTLDISIVEYDAGRMAYSVLASEGDLNLGGNDWDNALAKDVMKKMDIAEFSDNNEYARFVNSMNSLKHELSSKDFYTVPFKYEGQTKVVDYTRAEFEDVTKPLLDRAMELVKKTVLNYSPKGIKAIDKIVLVGGSCNMPQVMDRFRQEFPTKVVGDITKFDPSGAIARGAAIYAKIMSHTMPSSERMEIKQIASKTYGFNAINRNLNKEMIYNMIYKDTPFDGKDSIEVAVRNDQYFSAVSEDAEYVIFTVYESENLQGIGPDADWMDMNNGERPNGLVVSVDIPEKWIGRAGDYHLFPTFSLSKNGIFDLIVRDENGRIVSKKRSV